MKLLLFREGFMLASGESVATEVMLCARQLLCGCSGDLRTPTSEVCRAGRYESVRQRHFDHIRREDDKTCSPPSTWGHSRKYYRIIEQAGRNSASYKSGTRFCSTCRTEAPKGL